MAATLKLDPDTWDLTLTEHIDVAVETGAAAQAQDAASAIQTYQGECFYDTSVGMPWLTEVLGKSPTLALLKQRLVDAALTVPGVVSAQAYVTEFGGRGVSGQVQIIPDDGGPVAASNFTVLNPQEA